MSGRWKAQIAALFTRDVRPGDSLDTSLILAVSAWLIVNSHLENFYPHRWLAADGLLGNALFFWVSGYGIQSSLQSRPQTFRSYAARRLLRIYPATVVVLLIGLLGPTGRPYLDSVGDLARYVIWPTPYTYVRAIVPFYALLWLAWLWRPWALAASLVGAVGLYACIFASHLIDFDRSQGLVLGQLPLGLSWTYFWIATASGALMARTPVRSRSSVFRCSLLAVVLGLYFAAKYVLVVSRRDVEWFPMLHIAVLAACALALSTFCAPQAVRGALKIPVIGAVAALSANLTLEIYLVHSPLADVAALYDIAFPWNILAIVALTIAGAIALHLAVGRLRDWLEPRFFQPVQRTP